MSLDIERVLTYPTEGDDAVVTLLLGGIFSFLWFLFIPIFLITGYLVRALRAGIEGAEEPPAFDKWGDLLKEGLFAFIISFVYQLVPLTVLVVTIAISVVPLLTGTDVGVGVGLLGMFVGFTLWALLSFVFTFLSFAGLTNYAHTGRFGAAFDIDRIRTLLTAKPFLLGIVYVIVLNLVFGAIVTFLTAIPIIGLLFSLVLFFVGPFFSFYLLVVSGWLVGNGFGETITDTPEETGATEPAF